MLENTVYNSEETTILLQEQNAGNSNCYNRFWANGLETTGKKAFPVLNSK